MTQVSLVLKLILALFAIHLVTASELDDYETSFNSSCPIWTLPLENNGNITCKCGSGLNNHNIVICDRQTLRVYISMYHCMSYSDVLKKTVVGHCLYNVIHHYCDTSDRSCRTTYWTAPRLTQPNNNAMCGFREQAKSGKWSHYKHQTGLMCTSCMDGYGYPGYSYSVACVKCKDYKYNWLKYIAVAFLPLTIFFIIVILFRITATSGEMNGYILMCQLLATPGLVRIAAQFITTKTVFRVYFAFIAIWNLDFFRGLFNPFCLHPKLTTLQVLMLDYVIAVYPLLLVIVTYTFVKLHNRYSIVVRLWSPFYKCFAKFRNNWDINNSLVGAFATFILLSYVKILNVSFYALVPNTLYDVEGNIVPKLFLYYDGSYEYFGKDHVGYALIAIFMFLVFNVFPLVLLCLYPCRCFQRCLNYCKLTQFLSLHIFMDTFQGCYKLKPWDCRYVAAMYLVLRILNHTLMAITVDPSTYLILAGIMVITSMAIIAISSPYKSSLHTVTDTIFFATLSILCLGFSHDEFYKGFERHFFRYLADYIIFLPVQSLPALYGIGLFIYLLLPKKILLKAKSFGVQCYKFIKRQRIDAELESPRPYRLDHSDEYPPLLPVVEDSDSESS